MFKLNWSLSNIRSKLTKAEVYKNARQEVLKERFKESNNRHQTIAHMDSFTGNELIVNTGKEEHQDKKRFADSRFSLYFSLFF